MSKQLYHMCASLKGENKKERGDGLGTVEDVPAGRSPRNGWLVCMYTTVFEKKMFAVGDSCQVQICVRWIHVEYISI